MELERIEAERIKAEQDTAESKKTEDENVTPDNDSAVDGTKDEKDELKDLIDNKAD